jgi:hypothetical protein
MSILSELKKIPVGEKHLVNIIAGYLVDWNHKNVMGTIELASVVGVSRVCKKVVDVSIKNEFSHEHLVMGGQDKIDILELQIRRGQELLPKWTADDEYYAGVCVEEAKWRHRRRQHSAGPAVSMLMDVMRKADYDRRREMWFVMRTLKYRMDDLTSEIKMAKTPSLLDDEEEEETEEYKEEIASRLAEDESRLEKMKEGAQMYMHNVDQFLLATPMLHNAREVAREVERKEERQREREWQSE